jgi:transposase-like protein
VALAALEASGESVNAFGRRLGIVPQRLLWWRIRLRRSTPSFVPVEVTGTSPGGPAVVVVAEDGTRVEVSTADAASAEWVATILRSLRGRSR